MRMEAVLLLLAFGSELAPQVQQLRELRDNTVLQTSSGAAFMSTYSIKSIIHFHQR